MRVEVTGLGLRNPPLHLADLLAVSPSEERRGVQPDSPRGEPNDMSFDMNAPSVLVLHAADHDAGHSHRKSGACLGARTHVARSCDPRSH